MNVTLTLALLMLVDTPALDRLDASEEGVDAVVTDYQENWDARCYPQTIARLEDITKIRFGCHSHLTNDALAKIDALPQIEEVSVISDEITNEGLESFSNLPHLTSLDLNSESITDEGLVHLVNLDGLTDLRLMRCQITSEGIGQISKMPIKRLSLIRINIDEQAATHLKSMQGLESLTVGQLNDESMRIVRELQREMPHIEFTSY